MAAALQVRVDMSLRRNLLSAAAIRTSRDRPSRAIIVAEMRARGYSYYYGSTWDRRWAYMEDFSHDAAAYAQSLNWLDILLERLRKQLLGYADLLVAGEMELSDAIDMVAEANIRRRMRMVKTARILDSMLTKPEFIPEVVRIERWRDEQHRNFWRPVYRTLAESVGLQAPDSFFQDFTEYAATLGDGFARSAYLEEECAEGDRIDFAGIYGKKFSQALKSYIRDTTQGGGL
ncbi:hypothetical protein ACQP1S_00605 [Micromonospora matsumotoense]|uniref:hypothetical protein n=1 Tax=Micromonospora matsumotoense TaxID=121616 RepID=UPI003D9097B1